MQKISSIEAAGLLKSAGATIRALVEQNQQLTQKVASHALDERVGKVAKAMEDKGLLAEKSFEEKVALLKKANNLDVTEEAVKIAAPGGDLFGRVADEGQMSQGVSAFEQFILTGDAE